MRRRYSIILLLFTILSVIGFPNIAVTAFAHELPQYVTVGLRYGNTAVNYAEIKAESGLRFGQITEDEFDERSDLENNEMVGVSVEDDKMVLSDPDHAVLEAVGSGQAICLMPEDSDDVISFNEMQYRGGIILKLEDSGKITVINRLTLDEYLYGVLNQEMSSANPLEALKAQAVAARNFAVVKKGAHSAYGFDVCPTTHCQVYKGYESETEMTNRAVDETAGMLIYSDGEPIEAYYHKNSGGYTESCDNVWYASRPYLQAVEDPYSPNYPWSLVLTNEEIRNSLETAGYDPGTVLSVEILDRTESGGVYSLSIEGSEDTIILEKDKIRTVFGSTRVKSSLFDLSSDNGGDLTIRGADRSAQAEPTLYVVSREGSLRSIDRSDLYISNGSGASKAAVSYSESGLAIEGTGYGHRIGMSQDGAIEMANRGFDFEEILEFYYTGVEID